MGKILELLEAGTASKGELRFLPDMTGHRFKEIWDASAKAGGWMRRRVEPGGAVAAVLVSSFESLACAVGAWRAGLTLVSLPHPARGMAPSEYVSQIEAMCSLAKAELLLIDAPYVGLIPKTRVSIAAFQDYEAGLMLKTLGEGGQFIQFTSGSTTQPRGVRLTPEALAAQVTSLLKVLAPQSHDAACTWLPMSHDMGFIGLCLSSVVSGGPPWRADGGLTFIPPEMFLKRPRVWLETCSVMHATVTAAPNFALDIAARLLPHGERLNLRPLRACMVGGETVRAETLRRFRDAASPHGFEEGALCPGYGLAEATLAVSAVRPGEGWHATILDGSRLAEGEWKERDQGGVEIVSCGRPIPNARVRIGGATNGGVGEIEVQSDSLLSGYLGATDPFTSDGWLRTEDLGTLSRGEVYVTSRTSDVIMVAGRKLYATDLESVVARQRHIRDGACAVVTDGAGRYIVVVEPSREATDSVMSDVSRVIRLELTRVCSAAPSDVIFVQRGSLPKTPSGKIQRHAVLRRHAEGSLAVLSIN